MPLSDHNDVLRVLSWNIFNENRETSRILANTVEMHAWIYGKTADPAHHHSRPDLTIQSADL
jgi:hypothetical protein